MSIPPSAWMRCAKQHKAGVRRSDATSAWCAKCKEIVPVTPDYNLIVVSGRFASKS